MDRHDPAFGGRLDIGVDLGTETANSQTGPGKRMAVDDLRGKAEFPADLAHLILIVRTQRLDDTAGVDQPLDAGDAVMMRLDDGGFFGSAGFDGVGINSALAENPVAVQQMAGFDDALLHTHELFADDVALVFRVADAGERSEKLRFGGLDR